MTTAAKALAAAERELGYSRWDDLLEGTKYGRWYAERTHSPYFGASGVPFCAMGVSSVLDSIGVSLFGDGQLYAYCPWMRRDAAKHGRLLKARDVAPGDVLLFDWDFDGEDDHTGFAVRREGDYVHTIEFNTSPGVAGSQSNGGGVYRRVRHIGTISGVIRPAYEQVKATSLATSAAIAEDGVWGPATTTALQRALGTPVDGEVSSQSAGNLDYYPAAGGGWEWSTNPQGSQVITALQRKVGAGADGIAGFETARALQRHLGVEADGYVGEQTVKALQRRLNGGGI